jgi:transcriptional repressor NrdR
MDCPRCASTTSVLETRRAPDGATRRRRNCPGCGHRFTTFERIEAAALTVRKRDGRRQRFDRGKLRGALLRASHKRDVDPRALDEIVAAVEREAQSAGGELSAERIGERCLAGLEPLDRGAFLQFAGTLPDPGGRVRKLGLREPAGSVRKAEDAQRPTERASERS